MGSLIVPWRNVSNHAHQISVRQPIAPRLDGGHFLNLSCLGEFPPAMRHSTFKPVNASAVGDGRMV